MADGGGAGQAVDHLAPGEGVADQAEAALGMEALAVEGDDAGGFLAAMLERVQAERGDGGGVGMAEDAEHAALLAQAVGIRIEFDAVARSEPCWSIGYPRLARRAPDDRARIAGLASGCILVFRLRRFNRFKMVLSGSSGNMAFSHCPGSLQHHARFGVLHPVRAALRSGTSQAKNRKATTTMISPRAEPEQEAERAVERADPAVEHHVGNAHGDDRDDQQRQQEHAADGDAVRHHVAGEILLGHRQQLADRRTASPARRCPRRRSRAPRA